MKNKSIILLAGAALILTLGACSFDGELEEEWEMRFEDDDAVEYYDSFLTNILEVDHYAVTRRTEDFTQTEYLDGTSSKIVTEYETYTDTIYCFIKDNLYYVAYEDEDGNGGSYIEDEEYGPSDYSSTYKEMVLCEIINANKELDMDEVESIIMTDKGKIVTKNETKISGEGEATFIVTFEDGTKTELEFETDGERITKVSFSTNVSSGTYSEIYSFDYNTEFTIDIPDITADNWRGEK